MAPQFLFGNLLQTGVIWRGEPLPNVLRQFQDKFGDVFQFWFGPARMVVVSCLEDVQHIFSHRHIYEQADVFDEKMKSIVPNSIFCLTGSKYKRHTTITHPLFRRGKIVNHLDTIINCTDKLLTRWRTNNNDPNYIHLNMFEQLQQLVLETFSLIFFDYSLQTMDNQGDRNRNEFAHAIYTVLNTIITVIKMPTFIGRLYLLLNLKYRRSRDLVNQHLYRMIEQELQETPMMRAERKKLSLIASLIASLQQDEKLEASKTEEDKKGLSRAEVLDEMLSFLIAGYSTTTAALTWFIHLMSIHPEVQNKVKKELAQYNMQSLSVEQLDSFTYLDCVLREMFRFVPPGFGTLRTLTVDDRLPSTGAELRKGDLVLIGIHNMGRDRRYWSGPVDPDQFYPERFLVEGNDANNNKAASISFGGGHRQCIGQDLARFEVKAICARLMQRVTFGDGGPEVNSGEYAGDEGDAVTPKRMGVTITFDPDYST
ncbi:unnamed protein product [Rotaria sordida]|nr:unnamed protein product [Rotaria sordida]CAF1250250.1 unnamed protein product [Rotaria sordida]